MTVPAAASCTQPPTAAASIQVIEHQIERNPDLGLLGDGLGHLAGKYNASLPGGPTEECPGSDQGWTFGAVLLDGRGHGGRGGVHLHCLHRHWYWVFSDLSSTTGMVLGTNIDN